MSKDKKNNKEDLYKKHTETEGITENVTGEQTIQTSETKILKENGKEILIGNDIEEIEKVEESFDSLKNRILNK